MMWLNDTTNMKLENLEEDTESVSSGEEIPIWVRGEQRWVSGITEATTCDDVIRVLLNDERIRGKPIIDSSSSSCDKYRITERWRGVEQPLDDQAKILDIWNAWGTAQSEVKISLRRVRTDHDHQTGRRRTKCRSDSSNFSDRNLWKTVHPKRLQKHSENSTEELLKLVLAQGEVIRRQLRKLRHSEHQIGYLEEKTHRARVRKHGSNYLLETYLKGLPDAGHPLEEEELLQVGGDKNSDSGVITEDDHAHKIPTPPPTTVPPPDSSHYNSDDLYRRLELYEKVSKINKRLLEEESRISKLELDLKNYKSEEEVTKLRLEMTKSSCEMQHNEIVLEETCEKLENRRGILERLCEEMSKVEEEYETLRAWLGAELNRERRSINTNIYRTKESLDTLV